MSTIRTFDNDPNIYLMVGNQWFFYDPNRPPIGAGAMGRVFLGYNYQTGEETAIKQLYNEYAMNPDIRMRTEREASLSYSHPNLVEMIGCCIYVENGTYFMWVLSRYISGMNIDKYVQTNFSQLDADTRAHNISTMICSVCDALHYLHGKGVIHRDIKPSNIMVDNNGGVHLMDLGIARVSNNPKTATGFVGTLLYAPPEQILRDKIRRQATESSDIYSLGLTFYTLLNGSNPFDSPNEADIMANQLTKKLPPIQNLGKNLSKTLNAVLWKSTEKDQDKRYQTAEELKMAINEAFLPPAPMIPVRSIVAALIFLLVSVTLIILKFM